MKKRDIITLVILVIIFVIIFAIMLIFNKSKENSQSKTEFNNLVILNDESVFLSISKNINRICEYSSNNNQLLSFILKNDINSNNYINTSFKAEQIYVVSKLNLYKYYVKGNLYSENVDGYPEFLRKEYFIVNYDMDNSSYNIEIIDENRYKNASNEEYIFEAISNNDYNKFEYSSISQKSRANMYFNDFINKMYSNPEEAYELLSNKTKQTYFNTYDDFKQFILNHDNISLKEYSINDNTIGIKDNYDIEYIFQISYILKYNVTINQTED